MLGAIIGAVGSIVGSMIGGSSKEKTKGQTWSRSVNRTSHDVHLKQLVRESRKAGFNPMTILNAGGLSAYSTTTSRGDSYTRSKGSTSGSSTNLGAGIAGAASAIGDGVDAMAKVNTANAFSSPFNAASVSAASAQNDMSNALASVQTSTVGTQPTLQSAAVQTTGDWDGSAVKPEQGETKATNPWMNGSWMMVNPEAPDAEAWETRYGDSEVYSTLGGIKTNIHDFRYTFDKRIKEPVENWIKKTASEAWENSSFMTADDILGSVRISTVQPAYVQTQSVSPMAIGGASAP